MRAVIFATCLISVIVISSISCAETLKPTKIVFKSCGGCGLNAFPEVRQFLKYDLPLLSNVAVDFEGGGIPRFVLQDEYGEDYRTLSISKLTLKQIRQVLAQLGFFPSNEFMPIQKISALFKKDEEEKARNPFKDNTQEQAPKEQAKQQEPPKLNKNGRPATFSSRRGSLDVSQLATQGEQIYEGTPESSDEKSDL